MASQHPTEPLEKTGDNIVVNGEDYLLVTETKAAVRDNLTVDDSGCIVDSNNGHDENHVPESQPAPVSFVSATHPVKSK